MGIVQPGPPRDLVLHLRDSFGIADFVETGTFLGDTAAWAAGQFARAVTIEAAATLHARAVARHGQLGNLRLVLGDSRAELPRLLAASPRPALLWLDGHWSDGETFGQGAECPLLEELRAVAAATVEHFVLIDDARLFVTPPPPPHDPAQWPTMVQICDTLRIGGRNPHIVLVDDVIISVPASARDALDAYLRSKNRPVQVFSAPIDPKGESAGVLSARRPLRPATRAIADRTLPRDPAGALARLEALGLWRAGQPLRLHLGCGEQRIPATIGIDYPPSEHLVMNVAADAFADISNLELPPESVDEIRLHHVFEHFSRVTALGLLVRWHRWLKPGGQLRIETPDVMGSARTLLSQASLRVKLGVAGTWPAITPRRGPITWTSGSRSDSSTRCRASDSARFKTRQWSWDREPYLSNVEVVATKVERVPWQRQIEAAEELLQEATVAPAERPTWEVWRKQLAAFLEGGAPTKPGVGTTPAGTAAAPAPPVVATAGSIEAMLTRGASAKPLAEIHDYNQRGRDAWVTEKARSIPANARVLDVGAGTCPYRSFLTHCRYEAHDFKRYDGVKLGGTSAYGHIDHASDITKIPVPDGAFDVVLCTEVLEHVPEPIAALEEMVRVLRPGGRILLTAPLGSGLHQLPYHFYGGYTPEWYRQFAGRLGLEVAEIAPNGGFFKLLAQECARVAWTLPEHKALHGDDAALVARLFGELLPRYLYALEDKCFLDQFTAGYHVELRKPVATAAIRNGKAAAQSGAPVATGVIFSKDRPLQLDALLRSFALHCADAAQTPLRVLYACSDAAQEKAYADLARTHAHVKFVRESDFRADLLDIVDGARAVMFLVDDTLFVQPFSVAAALAELDRHPDALGFSLRLGHNTTYCYPLDRPQRTPAFEKPAAGVLKFQWTSGEHDFAYPLEVSSSIYRAEDIGPLLAWLPFRHPNSLEGALAPQAQLYRDARPSLLCFERSVAFAAPINRVQSTHANRAAADDARSPSALLRAFQQGQRIDVAAYAGFVPSACHQEIPVRLAGAANGATPAAPAKDSSRGASHDDDTGALRSTTSLRRAIPRSGKTAQAIAALEGYLTEAHAHARASHDSRGALRRGGTRRGGALAARAGGRPRSGEPAAARSARRRPGVKTDDGLSAPALA